MPRPPAAAPPALEVHGLRKTYDARSAPVRALRGVDLVVGTGEFVALTGPSGSGKSTLLHLVAGLETADEGTIALAGTTLDGLSSARLARMRRRHIGLVFQFFNLIDHMTALENVALPALVAGASPAAATERARELLDRLGLLDKSGELPATLSGGQRQRVAIARALVNRPTLLLADEPTGALDSAGTADVLDVLARINAAGQTILVVTHSAEVAAAAGRRVQLRDGRIVDEEAEALTAAGPA
ncbi:putative ABC transport system ATP-binding protein [Pseudonocardia thermophila]|jgi:ABC-type antimicrobial peptide transport system, ATPase component|uniref:Putative ABC transport system ATP-binding protein n=1 Tax=Pseudonocardia thermophila TaxID=1848 RepID=A0A1M6P750_PSETH|nr:ABC transporter ATP-binding protein [Pseudonocardia thermophila]SHK03764.1 putative ABC transport system ATP-binding protein [Pseudonocardia thermophila]